MGELPDVRQGDVWEVWEACAPWATFRVTVEAPCSNCWVRGQHVHVVTARNGVRVCLLLSDLGYRLVSRPDPEAVTCG